MFLQELKDVVLPNYLLVLSLLKPKEIKVVLNNKKIQSKQGKPVV